MLLDRALASTRTKAQELIRDGHVLVNGIALKKSGEKIDINSEISLVKSEHPFVSRGGVKLAAALDAFGINPEAKVALDIGLSTGGFSDCLLRRGAKQVYGIDVGTAQLAEPLRQNSKLTYWENLHIKDLRPEMLKQKVDLLVADLSFISLKKVIPFFRVFLRDGADLVLLVKPQFELEQGATNSKGIVVDSALRKEALSSVKKSVEDHSYSILAEIESPITGGDGNIEHFLHAVLRSP